MKRENLRKKGEQYEAEAVLLLQEQGYQVLEKNFYGRHGEIDIVARHQGYLVFVEVKYRSSCRYGSPEEAVDQRKRYHMLTTAREYLLLHQLDFDTPCRFDVVAFFGNTVRLLCNILE